jgi:MtN3 and saliva related transmembrane protein
MSTATAIGLFAGTFTTASWIPQIVRVFRLRRADEISWSFLVVLMTGVTGWLAYGLLIMSVSVILANTTTLALLSLMLGVKIWAGRRAPWIEADGPPLEPGGTSAFSWP